MRGTVIDLAILTIAKLAVSGFTLLVGFRAVSDDDYARVVIAQGFARAPTLDPSGTSWLPAPFWILGGAMRVFGRALWVAQVQAVALGVLAMWIVYAAGSWIARDRRVALVGALIACATSWSAMLGVSTVPELPTAALVLLAMASVAAMEPGRVVVGGAALLLACLSRYEPWFVAIPFAAYAASGAWRAPSHRARGLYVLGAGLAVIGPVGWILWNHHAHGAPLAFLASVSDYNEAVAPASTLRRLGTYAYAGLRAEPELIALTAVLVSSLTRASRAAAWDRFARPAWMSAFLFVALTAANVKGGAPTHHPERALVAPLLAVGLLAGRALTELVRAPREIARRLRVAVVAVAAASWPARRFVLRSEVLADRALEVDIGERAAARVAPAVKVHVDVVDYGYFAVLAATGRPEDFIPNEGRDLGGLGLPAVATDGLAAAVESGLPYAIVRASSAPRRASPLEKNDAWALLDVRAAITD
ncbi:MAG: glycosyltransferase family 39 protein [Polyangiaceae bacterium]